MKDNIVCKLIIISAVILPGLLNFFHAFYKLSENPKIRSYPFLKYWKSPGFYVWSILQVFFPSLAFYTFFPLNCSNTDIISIYLRASLFGICFAEIMNATTNISSIIVNIRIQYDFFLLIVDTMIANEQARDSRDFWREFQMQLAQQPRGNILNGLEYLQDCFTESKYLGNPINLNLLFCPIDKPSCLEELKTIKSSSDIVIRQLEQLHRKIQLERSSLGITDRAEEIIKLVKGNTKPKDLRTLLTRFGCSHIKHFEKLP